MNLSKMAVLLLLFLMAFACGSPESGETYQNAGDSTAAAESVSGAGLMNIELVSITGNSLTLASLSGKAYLLVNVASKCGNTPQYEGLEALYQQFKDSGLVVVGFPANNFGNQEPGTNEEILEFCQTRFDVTFPMMSKISVKGDDKHPLYVYLTEQSAYPGEIEWNFTKFLVDAGGTVIARYPTATRPLSEEVVSDVEAAL